MDLLVKEMRKDATVEVCDAFPIRFAVHTTNIERNRRPPSSFVG